MSGRKHRTKRRWDMRCDCASRNISCDSELHRRRPSRNRTAMITHAAHCSTKRLEITGSIHTTLRFATSETVSNLRVYCECPSVELLPHLSTCLPVAKSHNFIVMSSLPE